jgi:hypothetical protein
LRERERSCVGRPKDGWAVASAHPASTRHVAFTAGGRTHLYVCRVPREGRCLGRRVRSHAQPGIPPERCHQLPTAFTRRARRGSWRGCWRRATVTDARRSAGQGTAWTGCRWASGATRTRTTRITRSSTRAVCSLSSGPTVACPVSLPTRVVRMAACIMPQSWVAAGVNPLTTCAWAAASTPSRRVHGRRRQPPHDVCMGGGVNPLTTCAWAAAAQAREATTWARQPCAR